MFELAVWRPSQNRDLAAQCFEQFRTGDAPGTMVYIEHDFEPPGSDRFDIDELAHGVEMSLAGVRPLLASIPDLPSRPASNCRLRSNLSSRRPISSLKTEPSAENGLSPFHSIGLWLAVISMPPAAPKVPHQEAARWRGGDPHVEHPATDRFEACLHGPLEHHAGRAAVAGHDHRPAPAENAEGLRELHDEVRI